MNDWPAIPEQGGRRTTFESDLISRPVPDLVRRAVGPVEVYVRGAARSVQVNPRYALALWRAGALLMFRQDDAVVAGIPAGVVHASSARYSSGAATAAEPQVVLQLRGTAEWRIDGATEQLAAGDLLYVPANLVRELTTGEDAIWVVAAIAPRAPRSQERTVARLRRALLSEERFRRYGAVSWDAAGDVAEREIDAMLAVLREELATLLREET